jgi:subtilase family serine protease
VGALALVAGAASAKPMHVRYPGHFKQPPTTAQCEHQIGIACYGPQQFEQAYNMNPLYRAGLNGAGKTIVIVDSFGSPTIQQDLATFDSDYRLPAPPSLRVIQPAGQVPPFDSNNSDMTGWAIETSLDVEYAHAMAPGANILLVETPVSETEGTQGFPEIVQAENYVINHHLGDVISQSFGATEETFPSARSIYSLRSAFVNAFVHRITVLGASGDAGPTDNLLDGNGYYPFRVDSWPSTDPLVTSVGGTQLHLDASGNRLAPDNAWNDQALFGSPAASGGGTSVVFGRPEYQDRVARTVSRSRGTPDLSLSAAVDGGANVYWSFDDGSGDPPGYYIIGGTSEATPLFSGLIAVADQAARHDVGLVNDDLYQSPNRPRSGINDVTLGDTTVTFTNPSTEQYPGTHTVPGYTAVPGYDLATGLGTPDGTRLVGQLAGDRYSRDRH